MRGRVAVFGCVSALVLGCGPPPPPLPEPLPSGLPPVPTVDGPLLPRVTYPAAGSLVAANDSSFLFGSLGSGRASLSINGVPVPVRPNGSWLAWVALPPDSIMRFVLEARRDDEVAVLVHEARRQIGFRPADPRLWIDTTSLTPRGQIWWPAGEPLPIRVRASEGAALHLRLPDGRSVPLSSTLSAAELPEAIRAFDRDTSRRAASPPRDRYAGALVGLGVGPDLGDPVGSVPPADGPDPVLEAIRDGDTLRVAWPLRVTLLQGLPQLISLDDDPERSGLTDGITVGRAMPSATYHWFFPTGTRSVVRGRINDDLRLGLSATAEAWVAVAEAVALPTGLPAERAVVGSITASVLGPDRVRVRIPVSYRAPYRIEESEREVIVRFYRAAGDPNWIRLGESDGILALAQWSQTAADEVELRFGLRGVVWGYRARWDGSDLVLELRGPPPIDAAAPLRDRLIVVDPGHPPGGATGPTGLPEQEANLAVALRLRDLLTAGGARVVLTRSDAAPLDLWPRVRLADSLDADLLISIHNNALPDGVEPFRNSGSSVFYFHPRGAALARAVQSELVRRLGTRDLGVARGDLALVRGTWVPSILAEGLFMMLPEHEAALRDPDGQRAYAEAVYRGIVRFLDAHARRGTP